MRLGFWNRLAVVAAAISLIAAPTYITFDMGRSQRETIDLLYKSCIQSAVNRKVVAEALQAQKVCDDFLSKSYDSSPVSWSVWRELAFGTAAVIACIYLIILTFVIICKWVWRGREIKNTETA